MADLEERIHRLMLDHRSVFISSTTTDEIAKTLRASSKDVRKAVFRLVEKGIVEAAKKNPRSAQPRFQLAEAHSK